MLPQGVLTLIQKLIDRSLVLVLTAIGQAIVACRVVALVPLDEVGDGVAITVGVPLRGERATTGDRCGGSRRTGGLLDRARAEQNHDEEGRERADPEPSVRDQVPTLRASVSHAPA